MEVIEVVVSSIADLRGEERSVVPLEALQRRRMLHRHELEPYGWDHPRSQPHAWPRCHSNWPAADAALHAMVIVDVHTFGWVNQKSWGTSGTTENEPLGTKA